MRWLPSIRVTRSNQRTVATRIRKRFESPTSETLTHRIIEEVRRNGDAAVLEYNRKFDRVNLSKGQLKITRAELERSTECVDENLLSALRKSLKRLETVQKELLSRINYTTKLNEFTMKLAANPIPSVGCYIPGGKAAYPSTVLMTAGIAKMARIPRIVICTPPGSNGKVNDAILAAANLCGVNEVYRCGGAQAIAALAYGTETIPRVEKIVGPGGTYVSIAKRIVSRDIPIDFYAGPTEIVLFADKTANPTLAAWDLIAQAEHGPDTLACLVTCSTEVAAHVRSEISRILPTVERRRYVQESLANGTAAICENQETACEFINTIAPEHVELLSKNSYELSKRINAAGLILIGPYTPAAASDYCVGTNHVLPTGGFAKNHGGLSILDFMKLTWTVTGTKRGLQNILNPVKTLTMKEGLPNHYNSIQARFER